MPYDSNSDLPNSIKNNLPEHGQTIFRQAFNNAHEQYGNEQQAFKVAWAAMKKEKYKKSDEDTWIKK